MRTFWLGLGAGVVAATLVIGAGQTLQGQPPVSHSGMVEQPSTASDWQQAAQKAGMVVLTQAQLNQKLDQAKTDGANQKAAELAKQPPAPVAPTTVHLYIQPGMGTTDVARLLQAAGVLEDGNQLIELRQNSPNPIRAGVYDLPLKGNPADVLKAISTPPH